MRNAIALSIAAIALTIAATPRAEAGKVVIESVKICPVLKNGNRRLQKMLDKSMDRLRSITYLNDKGKKKTLVVGGKFLYFKSPVVAIHLPKRRCVTAVDGKKICWYQIHVMGKDWGTGDSAQRVISAIYCPPKPASKPAKRR